MLNGLFLLQEIREVRRFGLIIKRQALSVIHIRIQNLHDHW